jgi:predicted kinase
MVHLICGMISSGKSYYAAQLAKQENAVILSCDDLSLSLFPEGLGESHDAMMLRVHDYLFERAADIARTDTSVILEWGFWTRAARRQATEYYENLGISVKWHFMDVSESVLRSSVEARNKKVLAGEDRSYFVDEGLYQKMKSLFETPDETENLPGLTVIKRR